MSFQPFFVGDVLARATELTGVSRGEIVGPLRQLRFARVRFAIAYVLRNRGLSWAQIGRRMNRDHTTVISAYRRAVEEIATDPDFARLVRSLETRATDRPVCWTVPAYVRVGVAFGVAA